MFSRRRQKAPSIPFRISSKYNVCCLERLTITNIVKLPTPENNSLKHQTAASGWKHFDSSVRNNGCAWVCVLRRMCEYVLLVRAEAAK